MGTGSISGYYNGSVLYDAFCSRVSRFKTYGERIIKERRETFLKCANWLSETATDRSMVQHPGGIVLDPLCATRYVNEGRYL